MSWILPVLVAWAFLALPGYVMLRALDVQVSLRWGWAPAVTVILAVLLSTFFSLFGIPWHPLTVVACVTILAAVAVLLRRLHRRRQPGQHRSGQPPRTGDPLRNPTAHVVTSGGVVLAGLAVVASSSRRMGGIETLQGGYDAFFHLSAIAFIRDSGDAGLTTALTPIYGEPTFYPVMFDALAALLPFSTVTSANAMVLAVLAALPAAVAAMVASVLGPHRALPVAVTAGALASTLFLSTPAMALVMGLWPTVLGVLCLPVALASALHLADDPRRTVGVWPALGHLAVIVGAALAHPAVFFSVAVAAGMALLVRGSQRIVQRDDVRRGIVQLTLALLSACAAVALSATMLNGMNMTGPSPLPLRDVLRQILVDSPRIPVIGDPIWPVAVVMLLAVIGAVAGARHREPTTLTAGVGTLVCLGLSLATELPGALSAALVNPWYGARERIAPLLMCMLVILAARGVLAVVALSRARRRRAQAILAPLALGALLVTVAVALIVPQRLPLMGSLAYTAYGVHLAPYDTQQERDFIERTAAELPADAVVLADPRDGATLYWSIGGVTTVFPTLATPQTSDSRMLAAWYMSADEDERVCAAYQRLHPTHLYRDTSEHSGVALNPEASAPWDGLREIPDSLLTPVAGEGPYALYELEAPC
ncbi:MAG: DUF6541 family protein [Brachybacterium tyrofermentans]|uniref:DUF6541 family protein n=1 Tax=Brachybacterium tyrofermentans TaxID=47848 RepID=UPI000A1A4E2D|nr:DUF6541 family protein [Brachybacterium tyrofermentans]SLM98570.1 hypothetical protein FM103_05065 [Corynebacterium xerosis]